LRGACVSVALMRPCAAICAHAQHHSDLRRTRRRRSGLTAALHSGCAPGTQLPMAAVAVPQLAALCAHGFEAAGRGCKSGAVRQALATPAHPVMRRLDGAPAEERDFWLRLLAADPRARLTVDAALAHPFLRD